MQLVTPVEKLSCDLQCTVAYFGERKTNSVSNKMAIGSVEQKALSLLNAFEKAGKSVGKVVVEGKRIELELLSRDAVDEFDRIDMRYGKT